MVVQGNAAFAEESAEVQVLLASLSKTKDLTRKIGASLARLDASGRIVKDAIGPIYSNTQQIQVTSRNIDRVNEAIDKLRKPLDTKMREEAVIMGGPGKAGLREYLAAIRRVDRSLTDLTNSNMRSNKQAISEYHGLLTTGVNQLVGLYRESLQEEEPQIEPLHYITKGLPFPTFQADKVQHLGELSAAIVSASIHTARLTDRDDNPAIDIYASMRGDYLQNSLQNLATASINTAKRSANDTTVYKPNTNAVGTYAQSLENMLLAEFENVSRIFRGEIVSRIYTATCSKALSSFTRALTELNSIIKARILTDCFLAYEIIDLITPMSYRLEKRTNNLRPQIAEAVRPIRVTARASLYEMLRSTKQQAEMVATLPPDANTIPLVHDTAARMRTLGQFDKSLLHILTSVGDGGWRNDPSSMSATTLGSTNTPQSSQLNLAESASDNQQLLSNYLADMLDALLTGLSARSSQIHRNKAIQGIFMFNTVAVLQRALVSTPELEPYVLNSQSIMTRLDTHRKPAISSYMSVWRDPCNQLLDTISTSSSSRPMSGGALDSQAIIKSLSSKDKDKIKEKFREFTRLFEEQVARHKSLHMEREVALQLQRDISQQVEPLYQRFWDRYHDLDKGKGKTVKYTKVELAQVLASL